MEHFFLPFLGSFSVDQPPNNALVRRLIQQGRVPHISSPRPPPVLPRLAPAPEHSDPFQKSGGNTSSAVVFTTADQAKDGGARDNGAASALALAPLLPSTFQMGNGAPRIVSMPPPRANAPAQLKRALSPRGVHVKWFDHPVVRDRAVLFGGGLNLPPDPADLYACARVGQLGVYAYVTLRYGRRDGTRTKEDDDSAAFTLTAYDRCAFKRSNHPPDLAARPSQRLEASPRPLVAE